MGWKVWGDPYNVTADMESTALFQTVQINRDLVLRAVRTWVIVVGNPVFESLHMKLYSNEEISSKNTPRKLLHTSDARLKSEVHTLANGVKEIYFTFGDVPLRGADKYNLVINAAGYAPVGVAHLAWRKAFPDPVYGGFDPTTFETLPFAPYHISAIIGADI